MEQTWAETWTESLTETLTETWKKTWAENDEILKNCLHEVMNCQSDAWKIQIDSLTEQIGNFISCSTAAKVKKRVNYLFKELKLYLLELKGNLEMPQKLLSFFRKAIKS